MKLVIVPKNIPTVTPITISDIKLSQTNSIKPPHLNRASWRGIKHNHYKRNEYQFPQKV
tara:strand:+ start:621 stop:797 length:177 start_codon:yes stop_codon:yes gene_type:complete